MNGRRTQHLASPRRPKKPETARKKPPQGARYAVATIELRNLLEPLIEMNSLNWVATKMSTNTENLNKILYGQKFVELNTVDRWITKLGIPQAFNDGSLTIVPWPDTSQDPQTAD